jgi:hypothetical protein
MSRRLQNLDPDGPKADHRAIADRLEVVFCNRLPPQADGGAGAVAQFEMTGNEVGVKVRQEDVNMRRL